MEKESFLQISASPQRPLRLELFFSIEARESTNPGNLSTTPLVTSDLDPFPAISRLWSGRRRCRQRVQKTPQIICYQDFDLNPHALKILQPLFAKLAPVKPFQGKGGRGVSLASLNFPKRNWFEPTFPVASARFFLATSAQDILHSYA